VIFIKKKDTMADKKKFMDGEILKAMEMHLDEDPVVYGANGHYAIGAYHDITGINSAIAGDVDYNSQDNLDAATGATAAETYYTDNDEMAEELQKAIWMKEY
jgi:hypothetical protein